MRGLGAALAATLALSALAPPPVQVARGKVESAAAQERQGADPSAETATTAREEPAQDAGDDDGGVPIWAGIGLILLAAVAGSAAARARNRRRMREFSNE